MPYQNHPGIKTPSAQTRVWRYLSLDKFLFLLSKSQLYLCRADNFRDPWEGTWTRPLVEGLKSPEFSDRYRSEGQDTGKLILDFSEHMKKAMFMSCWHMNDHESAAMWDLYGGQGVTIAITSTVKRLKTSLQTEEIYHIGKVNYLDYDQDAIKELNALLPFFTKRRSFAHEHEVRVAIERLPIIDSKLDWQKAYGQLLVDVDLGSLIESVLISPTSPDWFVDIVQDVAMRYHPEGILVEKSQLYEPQLY